jgi:hypothetical protein
MAKQNKKENSTDQNSCKVQDKDGSYIFHRIVTTKGDFVIETLGDDPTACMKAIDSMWFKHRGKIRMEKIPSSTPFTYRIVRASGNPQRTCVLAYEPGYLTNLERKKNRRYDDFEDEDEDEEYDYSHYIDMY